MQTPEHSLRQLPSHAVSALRLLRDRCAAQGIDAWLTGGSVRDLLLGLPIHDLDITVNKDGLKLARSLSNELEGAFFALDEQRGAGRIILSPPGQPREVLDVVNLRAASLEDDLRLRDFTINALALPLVTSPETDPALLLADRERMLAALIDPCDGLNDLRVGLLRLCTPHSITDDAVRAMRALRLAASLRLKLHSDVETALYAIAPQVAIASRERVRDELLKLLATSDAGYWLQRMDSYGILTALIPELEPARLCDQPIVHFLPVLDHSFEAVVCLDWLLRGLAVDAPTLPPLLRLPVGVQTYPNLERTFRWVERLRTHLNAPMSDEHSRTAFFKFALLLHDNAKPQTKQPKPDGGVSFYGHPEQGAEISVAISERMRLSRGATSYVARLVREHMRPGQLRATPNVTPRAFARFFRDVGDAGPDLLILTMADHLATRGPNVDRADWRRHVGWTNWLLDDLYQKPEIPVAPLLDGNDLMRELHIGGGPTLGAILRELRAAQDAGDIRTRSQALELARQLLRDQST